MKESVATILIISTKREYQNLHGPVNGSVLEVEGILRHIRIFFRERSNVFDLSVLDHEDSDERTRGNGPPGTSTGEIGARWSWIPHLDTLFWIASQSS